MIVSASPGQAKDYFSEGLLREGYYSNGQELVGSWGGLGASKLGLKGEVAKEHFHALCDNLNPATLEQLTLRTKVNRRVGYDLNFHAPKGVTLAYEYLQDKRILNAFRESVTETMRELETATAARVRKGGKDEDRATGNLIWAEFVHFTARPVDSIADPHLHAHCFTFNATFDETEGLWKAGQFVSIKKNAPYYEAAFHARLAAKVRALGYEIERVGSSFELAGIPRDLVEKFSRRRAVIDAEAERLGITSDRGRNGLGALTREKKVKNQSKTELQAEWWNRLLPEEEAFLKGLQRSKKPIHENILDSQAVDFAIKHIFERKSVASLKQIQTEALRWGVGHVSVEQVKNMVETRPEILKKEAYGEMLATTGKVLAEEEDIIAWARYGKNKAYAINPHWAIEDERLNLDQRRAILNVLQSKDRVIGIQGKAGTGKTTLMVEAARAIRGGGFNLLVVAPTSNAAREVLRSEGFQEADTVARLLQSEDLQERIRGGVLWIDEAGLLSTPQMAQVAKLANRLNARVILSGDTGQHHAVERGNAFEILQKQGALSITKVEKVMRQTGAYRTAVEKIAAKQYPEAFDIMDKMGAFKEIVGPNQERHKALASDYIAAIKANKTAIVVSPTHAECRDVSGRIREHLKELGKVDDGRKWNILRPLDLSEAQKSDSSFYRPGLIVRLHRHAPKLKASQEYKIDRVEKDRLWLRDGENATPLPFSASDRWSVFEPDSVEIAKGDRVRITANIKDQDGHELTNGAIYQVLGFTKAGEVILSNKSHLPKSCGYLTHGYAVTSHTSQGKTVDRVFIAQSGRSLDVADAEQFYVSVSRGKELVRVYTDDLEMLKEAVSLSRERLSAKEVGFERPPVQGLGMGM